MYGKAITFAKPMEVAKIVAQKCKYGWLDTGFNFNVNQKCRY